MPPPSAEFNHSAHCFSELAVVMERLPEVMCENKTMAEENQECWNGHQVKA